MSDIEPDGGAVPAAIRQSVEDFVYREADFLDRCAYDDWLSLWDTGDIEYSVPCNSDDPDATTGLAIIRDNRVHLEERIARMQHRRAHTFATAGRFQRVVSNFRVIARHGILTAYSSFVLGALRRGQQEHWFGRTEHVFAQRNNPELKMRRKKVMLLNNDEPMSNVLFLP